MAEIKDGGPAFPVECDWIDGQPQGRQTATHAGWHEGMTLRDWFAAKAMDQALCMHQMECYMQGAGQLSGTEYLDAAAQAAYSIADAMLRTRGQS